MYACTLAECLQMWVWFICWALFQFKLALIDVHIALHTHLLIPKHRQFRKSSTPLIRTCLDKPDTPWKPAFFFKCILKGQTKVELTCTETILYGQFWRTPNKVTYLHKYTEENYFGWRKFLQFIVQVLAMGNIYLPNVSVKFARKQHYSDNLKNPIEFLS